jgi:hypothetical protein
MEKAMPSLKGKIVLIIPGGQAAFLAICTPS